MQEQIHLVGKQNFKKNKGVSGTNFKINIDKKN